MANIEKPKFHILEVKDGTSNERDKANALIFIRRHLHESLQTQYLSVRDPHILWRRLKNRYDYTKTQYRQRQFATYSELISVLLTAEQTNELLLKNHDLKPAGSKALPEAHANFEKNTGHFKGYKRRQEHNPRRDDNKFNHLRKSNFSLNHGKEKKPKKSRTCRMPKHFVDLYQTSLKNTGKCGESHAIEINPTAITTVDANNISVGGTPLAPEVANASLDVSDFFEDL
ncbi:hypothetical protein EUGRSUZ_F04051 [Eucalyptus grandis]|uniref:Uncharacterized protein n=2 Tax=Eucalyptus grandis TaxID=71139 RepID=A0ACC3KPG8_EUCGR|nr:hypothetical protein EUGRSUZ_F04051 [Eucalyptus grandis]